MKVCSRELLQLTVKKNNFCPDGLSLGVVAVMRPVQAVVADLLSHHSAGPAETASALQQGHARSTAELLDRSASSRAGVLDAIVCDKSMRPSAGTFQVVPGMEAACLKLSNQVQQALMCTSQARLPGLAAHGLLAGAAWEACPALWPCDDAWSAWLKLWMVMFN